MHQQSSGWNSVSDWNLQWNSVFSSSEMASIQLGDGMERASSVFSGKMLSLDSTHRIFFGVVENCKMQPAGKPSQSNPLGKKAPR